MPYTGRDWDTVDPTVELPYTYDFSNRIPENDSITSTTWLLESAPNNKYYVVDSNDLSTYLTNSSSSQFEATIWNLPNKLLGNARYKLTVFITTSSGIKDDLWSYVSCDPAP